MPTGARPRLVSALTVLFVLIPTSKPHELPPSFHIGAVPTVALDRLPTSNAEVSTVLSDRGLPPNKPALFSLRDTEFVDSLASKWTPDYLQAALPQLSSQASGNNDGLFLYDRLVDERLPARWRLLSPSGLQPVPGVTMRSLLHGGFDPAFRYLSVHVSEATPSLLEDVAPVLPGDGVKVHVWAGSVGCQATPHFDYEDNVFTQLRGEKRFVLFPPKEQARFAMHPLLHPSWRQGQVFDPTAHGTLFSDVLLGNGTLGAEAFEVVLRPGDVLYVPSYWLHWVTALSPSISFNLWFDGVEGRKRRDMKQLMQQLGGVPIDKRLPPAYVAAGARLYVRRLLKAVFGRAKPTLRYILRTRYRLYRWVLAEAAEVDASGGSEMGGGLHHNVRAAWGERVAASVGSLPPSSHGGVWEDLAARRPTSEQRYRDMVVARVDHVVAGLAPVMQEFREGSKHLVVMDHIDVVGSVVISVCVPVDRLVRNANPGLVTDIIPNGARNGDGHDMAAWVRESLLV